jgi:hypothetical protein
MEIQLREVLATTGAWSEIIAHHTGRPSSRWQPTSTATTT